MILCRLLEIDFDNWEEKVVAAAFLQGLSIMTGAFEAATAVKINLALEKLAKLPADWAKELCLEVFQNGPQAIQLTQES